MGGFCIRIKTDDEKERFKKILLSEEVGSVLLPTYNIIKENIPQFTQQFNDAINSGRIICYLLCNEEKDLGIGVILLFPPIKKCVTDVGALLDGRGKDLKHATLGAVKDFFDENSDYDMYSFVRNDNRKSLIFSQQVGLKIFKRLSNSYVLRYKHGRQ